MRLSGLRRSPPRYPRRKKGPRFWARPHSSKGGNVDARQEKEALEKAERLNAAYKTLLKAAGIDTARKLADVLGLSRTNNDASTFLNNPVKMKNKHLLALFEYVVKLNPQGEQAEDIEAAFEAIGIVEEGKDSEQVLTEMKRALDRANNRKRVLRAVASLDEGGLDTLCKVAMALLAERGNPNPDAQEAQRVAREAQFIAEMAKSK